jgi:hypothetical protein
MSRQGGKGDEEGLLYFFRIVGDTPVEREPKKIRTCRAFGCQRCALILLELLKE